MSTKHLIPKKNEIIIHDYDYRISKIYERIERDLSAETVNLIKKYDMDMIKQSLAKATRLKNLEIVLNLSRYIKKEWSEVTKDDIDNLVYKIVQMYSRESGQETNTTWDHKKILKIFFRWLKTGSRDFREVGDPVETKSVKLRPVKDKIVREELLTEDDRTRLLYACGENSRDRAFIDVHYEAGTRPGEILSLRIKHVKFDNIGAVIHVDGKTGARPIRIIRSVPNLAKWLDVHPRKSEPEAPLWIQLDKNNFGKPLDHSGARAMVQRRCEKAGLSKRVNLKLFRHSEATISANFMTEAQMRIRHGWTSTSKMPARYVHLVSADVENALLDHYGIKKEEKIKLELPKKCHVCEMQNSPESTLCSKCGKPLDLESALEIEEKHEIEKLEREKRLSELEDATRKLSEKVESLETIKREIQKIHSKINETKNRESDPSNPHFPDGGPFDTRLVNLEVHEVSKDSIVLYDLEFCEGIDVVFRKGKVYCTLDKSSTCKHVLFALANPEFYEIVKKNNIMVKIDQLS